MAPSDPNATPAEPTPTPETPTPQPEPQPQPAEVAALPAHEQPVEQPAAT